MRPQRLLDRYQGARTWGDDVTVVGPRLFFRGEIDSPGAVVVAGQVDGPITCGALVRVLAGGLVRGAITAESACIEGRVEGAVVVSDQLDVRPSARVKGAVEAARLSIGDGAKVRGPIRADQPIVHYFDQRRG